MMSSPKKRNHAKIFQVYEDHGNDTEHCNELKKEIESTIKGGLLKNFIDDVSEVKI